MVLVYKMSSSESTEKSPVAIKRTVGYENVPTLDGTENVVSWLETFVLFGKVNRWSEEECIAVLPLRLTNSAKSWYRSHSETAIEEVKSWSLLKTALREQFEVKHTNAAVIGCLGRVRQNPTERVLEYHTRFLDLVHLLPDPLPSATIAEFFVEGLLPSLKEKVINLAVIKPTMSQALEVAKRFCLSLQSATTSPRHSDDARVVYQTQRKDSIDDSVFEAIRDLQHEVRRLRETQVFNVNHVGFSESDARTPAHRNYRDYERKIHSCHLCKGPHYLSVCPDRAAFDEWQSSGKSKASASQMLNAKNPV